MRSPTRILRRLLGATLLGLSFAGVSAQIATSSLTGIVADPSGASIPHVQVTVTNKDTGLTRTEETDGAGFYTFPTLPIGLYKVFVAQTGFAAVEQEVQLDAAQKTRRDFSLTVGSSRETVTVNAAGSTLSPDDASISTVIDSNIITQTPLYQRNWDDLLRTVPGVQIARFTQQSGATSAGRIGSFNVHGVHSLQNNFILDGIDNNTISENVQELSTEAAHPSVDVIDQFTIVTSPYSAEHGRAPGAALSVNTKGGGNKIHLLAFEYLRNDFFDATDYFTKRQGFRKAKNRQNQFGGSVSGPILHDRLFGFFNYEGTRITQGVTRISTVPLPNERIGDFSPAKALALGVKYPTIYDPKTNLPFANNQIPAARLDKAIQGIMALFPQPNVPGAQLNNYFRNAVLTDNNDSYDGRADWTASARDNLFVRYSYINRTRYIPGNYGGIADGTSTSAFGRQKIQSHSAVIGWTRVFSPKAVNEFHVGFIRNRSVAVQDPFGLNPADQYVPGIPNNPAVAGGVPLTQFANFTFIGSPDFLPKSQVPQQIQTIDTVSISFGKHALRVGGTVYAPLRNIFQDEPGARGDLGFSGIFSCKRGGANFGCIDGGISYADGLLGLAQSTQLTNVHFVDQRLFIASGFVQDDWKVSSHLTLNLGLRYDFATPALEGRNQQANFDPAANGGAGGLVFARSGSLKDRGLVNPNYKNFAPRIGIAYSPDGKTTIRAGYGIFYSLFERFGSENQLALNPPFLINKSPAVASNSTTPALVAQVGFPSNFLDPATLNLSQLQAYHLRTMNPHAPTPNIQQWSLGFQRELPGNFTAEVNYVGTKSTHLDVLSDLNQPSIARPGSPSKVPYTNFGYIEYTNSIGYGNYNGLESSIARRFSSGLSLRGAYTYSQSLDNTPQELESNSGAPPDGRNYAAWYAQSDFNTPQRFSFNYVYELPFGPGKAFLSSGPLARVLGGFRTSGVYNYYSGRPFTLNGGGTRANALDPYGAATATVNLVGTPTIVGTVNRWYNPAAYALAPIGAIGNVGRNTVRGPHTNVFDASLLREFPIRERTNLEFRWEVFNVSNTPLFGQPNNNISSGAAGQITTLSGDQRVMQLALRLSY